MDTLLRKFGLLSATMTVAAMYFAIIYLLPEITIHPSLKLAATIVSSLILYRLIATGMFGLFNRWLWLRKIFLGEEFIEGTWVGRIRREPVEYTVEEYRYRKGRIEIEGRSFLEDRTPRSHWDSTAASVDVGHRKVFYAYACRVEGADRPPEGVASFNMQWEDSTKRSCDRLEGFAADLTDGEKDPNSEHKVSDRWIGFEKGLDAALRIFKNKAAKKYMQNNVRPDSDTNDSS